MRSGFGVYRPVRDKSNNIIRFDVLYENREAGRLPLRAFLRAAAKAGTGMEFFAMLAKVAETGRNPRKSLRLSFSGGPPRTFSFNCSRYKDSVVVIWHEASSRSAETHGDDMATQAGIEAGLRKAYKDLETVLDANPAPICVISNGEGRILGSNPAFARLCSLKNPDDAYKAPVSSFFRLNTPKSPESLIDKLRKARHLNLSMLKMDGTFIDVEIISQPLVYREQDAIAIYCLDLTERNVREEALRKTVLAAEEASRMKSVFLANLSHEVRAPLNGVIGFVALALDDEIVSEKAREYLEKIKFSAEGVLQVINDILDISRLEAGKIALETIPFDLREVLSHCETVSSARAAEKGLNLSVYFESLGGRILLGDQVKLRQVLLNLLSNAIKFTEHGIVKLTAIARESEGGTVTIVFSVRDSGVGIPSEQLDNIFDPSLNKEKGTTSKFGGTGFGLGITKALVELMGGNLIAESLTGVGSKFSFTLKFETIDAPEREIDDEAGLPEEYKRPRFSGNVLIFEDNSISQQVIREHLTRVGINAVVVANGKKGVELVKEQMLKGESFDLIFMDVQLLAMDGITATRALREMGCKTPIIAMTANAMSEDRENSLEAGMDDHMTKPFKAVDLWGVLRKYIKTI